MRKAALEDKYEVPCYVRWDLVPINLHPRSWYAAQGIRISRRTAPDAIKGGGVSRGISFLFKEEHYLPEEMWTKPEVIEYERPRLRVNYE